jgi:hypothetical protein
VICPTLGSNHVGSTSICHAAATFASAATATPLSIAALDDSPGQNGRTQGPSIGQQSATTMDQIPSTETSGTTGSHSKSTAPSMITVVEEATARWNVGTVTHVAADVETSPMLSSTRLHYSLNQFSVVSSWRIFLTFCLLATYIVVNYLTIIVLASHLVWY